MLLAQKNDATRLFSGLADLDFEPGYGDHIYFQHLLASNNGEGVALLEAYHSEKIYSKYIIRVSGKGFTLVDHHLKFMGSPMLMNALMGICLFIWFWILMRGKSPIP